MIQFGIFQNGASDLPVADTPSGVLVAGGSLEDMHASYQRILVDQVRQGVLADQLGYDFYFMTEHHFQPEGPEFSPKIERIDRSLEMEWNYYGPFGFTAGLADADEAPYPLDMRVTGALLRQKETALVGRADEVIAALLRMKELVGVEDFLVLCHFEMPGLSGAEVEEQMSLFAEHVMPELHRACGGSPVLPESTIDLVPQTSTQA